FTVEGTARCFLAVCFVGAWTCVVRGFAGTCTAGVGTGGVAVFLLDPPSTSMLAASPTAASSPTSARILICGLTVRFTCSSPRLSASADRAGAGREERPDGDAAARSVLHGDPAARGRGHAEVRGGGCEADRVDHE